jgi:hypothetical protein
VHQYIGASPGSYIYIMTLAAQSNLNVIHLCKPMYTNWPPCPQAAVTVAGWLTVAGYLVRATVTVTVTVRLGVGLPAGGRGRHSLSISPLSGPMRGNQAVLPVHVASASGFPTERAAASPQACRAASEDAVHTIAIGRHKKTFPFSMKGKSQSAADWRPAGR